MLRASVSIAATHAPCMPQISQRSHRIHSFASVREGNPPCATQGAFVTGLKCDRRTKQYGRGCEQVVSSFLGVGAPEAFLVGVVALVVFGPQGLAQAAKSVGTTLKSFQPTIQELSQVSNELKDTIQNEMGLDEFQRDLDSIRNPTKPTVPDPVNLDVKDAIIDPKPKSTLTGTAEAIEDEATFKKKLEDSKKEAWGGSYPGELSSTKEVVDTGKKVEAKKSLTDMTMSELEAELEKRKAVIKELSKDA